MAPTHIRAFATALILVVLSALASPAPTRAECAFFDAWPSFRIAAPTARSIYIGEVVESYARDSADFDVKFRFAVEEVLRGSAVSELFFHSVVYSGLPLVCRDSILRVHVGDVLALAMDAHYPGATGAVLAVAWVRGVPDESSMKGAEILTLAEVRAAAGLPPTDGSLDGPPVMLPSAVPLATLLGATAGFTVLAFGGKRRKSRSRHGR